MNKLELYKKPMLKFLVGKVVFKAVKFDTDLIEDKPVLYNPHDAVWKF